MAKIPVYNSLICVCEDLFSELFTEAKCPSDPLDLLDMLCSVTRSEGRKSALDAVRYLRNYISHVIPKDDTSKEPSWEDVSDAYSVLLRWLSSLLRHGKSSWSRLLHYGIAADYAAIMALMDSAGTSTESANETKTSSLQTNNEVDEDTFSPDDVIAAIQESSLVRKCLFSDLKHDKNRNNYKGWPLIIFTGRWRGRTGVISSWNGTVVSVRVDGHSEKVLMNMKTEVGFLRKGY